MLKGIAASDGIAAAKAYMLVQPDLSFSETSIDDSEAEIKSSNFINSRKSLYGHCIRSWIGANH